MTSAWAYSFIAYVLQLAIDLTEFFAAMPFQASWLVVKVAVSNAIAPVAKFCSLKAVGGCLTVAETLVSLSMGLASIITHHLLYTRLGLLITLAFSGVPKGLLESKSKCAQLLDEFKLALNEKPLPNHHAADLSLQQAEIDCRGALNLAQVSRFKSILGKVNSAVEAYAASEAADRALEEATIKLTRLKKTSGKDKFHKREQSAALAVRQQLDALIDMKKENFDTRLLISRAQVLVKLAEVLTLVNPEHSGLIVEIKSLMSELLTKIEGQSDRENIRAFLEKRGDQQIPSGIAELVSKFKEAQAIKPVPEVIAPEVVAPEQIAPEAEHSSEEDDCGCSDCH